MATEEVIPQPDGLTPAERHEKLIVEQETVVCNLAAEVAGHELMLQSARAQQHSLPPEAYFNIAQGYRDYESKLKGAINRLVDLHKEGILLVKAEN